MGFFSRLNDRVVAWTRRRSGEAHVVGVSVADHLVACTLSNGTTQTLDLNQVTRAVGVTVDNFVGMQVVLLLEVADPPQLLQVAESVDGWEQVCRAVDTLPGSVPYLAWYPRLVANADGTPIDILPGRAPCG